MAETLVILDYGSQYTQLIARRIRELGVYSLILPFNADIKEIKKRNLLGIILSGGPNSVYNKNAPWLRPEVFKLDVPILGICYGLQLITQSLGGEVTAGESREYGEASLQLIEPDQLIKKSYGGSTVWMSHGDHVVRAPKGFKVTARSGGIICAIENRQRRIYGLQFHPEVAHSTHGRKMLANFLNLCGSKRNWRPTSIIEEQTESIRQIVGTHNVVSALSGGVDSSIASTLVDRAIGQRQTCIFVDNGLLRQSEYEEVLAVYRETGLNVRPVRAGQQFLSALKGITDPEQKRKIIGQQFIRIFEQEAKKIPDVKFLVQGTLYPDVIESVSVNGPAAVIKSHHNVGGLPERMHLKLIEPLREIFKDEVRAIGRQLGLPAAIVERQAFPGPGLAVRIVGEITPERVVLLQKADAIVRQEIENLPEVRRELYQYFAVLLPIKSVGVMGDKRTYEEVIAVKAFGSTDAMTADWAHLPYDLLGIISGRIVKEVHGINRVVYDITSKPPATIEWE